MVLKMENTKQNKKIRSHFLSMIPSTWWSEYLFYLASLSVLFLSQFIWTSFQKDFLTFIEIMQLSLVKLRLMLWIKIKGKKHYTDIAFSFNVCGLREQKAYCMGDIFPLVPCIICYMSSARWFPGWMWNPLALTQCSHLSSAADSPRSPRKLSNTCCHGQMLRRFGNIRPKYKGAGPVSFCRKCMSYLFYFQKQSISTTYIKSDLVC